MLRVLASLAFVILASLCGASGSIYSSYFAKFREAFRVALPIRDTRGGQDLLEKVSTLSSPSYGQWLSRDEVTKRFAPSYPPEEVQTWMETALHEGVFCSCTSEACWSLSCFAAEANDVLDDLMAELPSSVHAYGFGPEHRFPAHRVRAKVRQGPSSYYVLPQTLQNLYDVDYSIHEPVGAGPTEFQNDSSFLPSDLALFAKATGLPVHSPTKNHTVGPFSDSYADIESSLDMDYVAGLAPAVQMWFWTAPGWIIDTVEDMLDHKTLPEVMTWSWGWSENDQGTITGTNNSHAYVRHGNDRLMLLALRGVTVVVSSGDAGAPGRTNENCNGASALNAVFPGASPYVLSAGATSLYNLTLWRDQAGKPPLCNATAACAHGGHEGMCYNGGPGGCFWTAGGGFSNVSARPFYQDHVVPDYLADKSASKPFGLFNTSGRGYPDLAANGHNYYVVANGAPMAVDGTSASGPTIGAIIARLNALRYAHGQPQLGFANPALYTAAQTCATCFNDPIPGWNNCTESTCCPYGFQGRAKGWDANTGLGTPNFTALANFLI